MLVVGDRTTLKVHVHTDDPNAATGLFAGAGPSRTSTSPTCTSRSQRTRGRLVGDGGPVAAARSRWSTGDGMRALFESLGVRVLDGGPTLNPSTYDLLAAIHAIPAEEVVVLPNSPNVVMAAERAAELSDKAGARRPVALAAGRARRRRQPRPEPRRASENAAAMTETLGRVRTGAVAPGRPRRRPGTLPRGRRRRLRRRGDRRLGPAARDARATCSSSSPRTPS